MTMHLAHPALTLGGKRKGKQKFRNADEARKARELAQEWERKQAEWKAMSKSVPKSFTTERVTLVRGITHRQTEKVGTSLNSWITGPVTTRQSHQYTGSKMIGIGTMHKSNAVPIFTDEQAHDISHMRR